MICEKMGPLRKVLKTPLARILGLPNLTFASSILPTQITDSFFLRLYYKPGYGAIVRKLMIEWEDGWMGVVTKAAR